ncbi:MAG: Calx-beta domain-containing protein [Desulfobacterales bacterium]
MFGTNPNGYTYSDETEDSCVVADGDEIELLRITRGWLSQGITHALTAFGGEGGDTFNVYSNKAVLRMEGESGNDMFVIRAFIAEDDIIAEGGGDDDHFEYNINAPVSINGGLGFDTVVAIGSEKSDAFIVTDEGIFGAGLNIRLDGVEEAVEVDGLEGDDYFYILSTRDNVVTTVIGGLGSDSFVVTGDVTMDVVSQNLDGLSAVINHGASSTDAEYDKLLADGVAITIATESQGKVIIDQDTEATSPGLTRVTEDSGDQDGYWISLFKPTGLDDSTVAYLTVSAAASSSYDRRLPLRGSDAAESILISIDDGVTWQSSAVMTFTATTWDTPQRVLVKAAHDDAIEGERKVMISHSLLVESDTQADIDAFNEIAVPNVEVQVIDDDLGTLLIEQVDASGAVDNETRVLEGVNILNSLDEVIGSSAIDDTYKVRLSVAPIADVTVNLGFDNTQLALFDINDDAVTQITFTTENWDDWVTLTVKAVNTVEGGTETVRENSQVSRIVHTFTSTDPVYDSPDGITRFDGDSWIEDGFVAGDEIVVIGSDANDGTYTVAAVTDTVLTLTSSANLTTDLADMFTITRGGDELFSGKANFDNNLQGPDPVELDVRVLDDDSAGVLVTESEGATRIVKGGATDDYTLRLVSAPSGPVTVNIFGDGQSRVVSAMLGDESRLETAAIGEAVGIGVVIGTDTTTNEGSEVTRTTLTRSDGLSWGDDGYQIGTLFTIDGGATFKVNNVIDDIDEDSGAVLSSTLVLTLGGDLTGISDGTYDFQRRADAVTFDATNWWQEVTVTIEADTDFIADPDQQYLHKEPVRQHLSNRIAGPLIIEGGVAEGKDRSVKAAVMLPTEFTAPPIDVAVLTDETHQADRLNVFNDSSTADDIGWMSAVELRNDVIKLGDADDTNTVQPINLSGLGMRPDTDGRSTGLDVDISEDQDGSMIVTFPGGITFDDIEITEILLGQGNDTFNIAATSTGTPDADDYIVTVIHGGGNTEVTDPDTGETVMGGDAITVTGGGGPASPLVIYGDTSQDGSRYDSRPDLGIFTGNALYFDSHGNDVIDASASNGAVTIYGGRGDDLIYGSQAGDHIAGGSGDDEIHGESGSDHIYGDSGFNLDFDVTVDGEGVHSVARELTVVTLDASRILTRDDLTAGTDTIHGDAGDDIIFGDLGVVDQSSLKLLSTGDVTEIRSERYANGEIDHLYGGTGSDVILGGNKGDEIDAGEGNNLVFGDEGRILYNQDGNLADIDLVESLSTTAEGGIDTITTGSGSDLVIGGREGDEIDAGAGNNLVIGDSGRITAALTDGQQLSGIPMTFGLIETMTSDDGGDDDITTGIGYDIVLGGQGGDTIIANDGESETSIDAGNIVLGDNGSLDYTRADRDPMEAGADLDPSDLDLVLSIDESIGGNDEITTGDGSDLVIGGAGSDTITVNHGNNLVLGDSGQITAASSTGPQLDGLPLTIGEILTTADGIGGTDYITSGSGNDILVGGTNDIDDSESTEDVDERVEVITAGDGNNIMLGDSGRIDYTRADRELAIAGADTNPADIDLIESSSTTAFGGVDVITSGSGSDLVIGGREGDEIDAGAGNNLVIGDSGRITAASTDGPQLAGIPMTFGLIETIEFGDGGVDTVTTLDGRDIVLGGDDGDVIDVGEGNNIVIGDDGKIDYTRADRESAAGADTNAADIDLIESLSTESAGGADTIDTGDGDDIIIGGRFGDTIQGRNGHNIVFGDSGQMVAAVVDAPQFAGQPITIDLVTTIQPDDGGADTISTGDDNDIILGGFDGDTITAGGDSDYVLGDNGRLDYVLASDYVEGRPDIETVTLDGSVDNPSTLDLVSTTDPTHGGDDVIRGNAGDDVIFGGTGKDRIWGDTSDSANGTGPDGDDGKDLIFGDHGKVYPSLPNANPGKYYNNNFFAIDTQETDLGNDDVIFGNGDDDTILGQQGDDVIFGGTGYDILIGGHNVLNGHDEMDDMDAAQIAAITSGVLANKNPSDINDINDVMDGGSEEDILAGDNAIVIRQVDSVGPRFQTLAGDTVYSMINQSLDGLISVNIGFEPNVDGTSQAKPDSTVGYTATLLNHSAAIEQAAAENPALPRWFGNDVMAGGSQDDMLFGELGDDVMQGDGSIDLQATGNAEDAVSFHPSPTANPSFTIPDGSGYFLVDDDPVNDTVDESVMLLFKVDERSADGDDYMEGNGGNDRMYGNLGQDDMIGGSSVLFGLDDDTAAFYEIAAGDFARPDGADLMYGSAGDPARLARNDFVGTGLTEPAGDDTLIPVANRHALDADVMMGDNANIYRLVGVKDYTENGITDPIYGYLQFNYDKSYDTGISETAVVTEDRGDLRIKPRAVELLDYTYSFDDSDPYDIKAQWSGIGYGDLMYGESGDDIIHGMSGDDVLFGNSEDDDLYGEIGADWISGGTGIDGILGDDGLLLTSRNSLMGEHLYGIAANSPYQGVLKSNEEVDTNSLNAVISTPGKIQQATINIDGEIKKAVDLIAFDLDGITAGCNDILYGGLGDDWMHAGSGDDAMLGGEALPFFYTNGMIMEGSQEYTANDLLKIQQQEPANVGMANAENPFWFAFAPYNPGDILRYEGETVDIGDDPHGKTRQEFALYDEYFPRRKLFLDIEGNAVTTESEGVFDFLLNFDETEGPLGFAFTGGAKATDGDDRMFGDAGNDWIVGGTGRDHMYGGRGDDLLNMDDDHDSGGEATNKNPNPDPLDNTIADEYQAYADIAYGGAGRDIMIINTGADRAIDWVGEYNSYIAPFSPFGAFHISRALAPQIPEYIIALADSDGTDTTIPHGTLYAEQKSYDVRVDDPSSPEFAFRQGEPYGELGMVRQSDYDWQAQTGAPNDPQPGNLQGQREIMRRELFTEGDPMFAFSPEIGTWLLVNGTYQAAPEVLGEDAISIYHLDDIQPPYMEILAGMSVNKGTGGLKANAYIIFDYQDPMNFKFAGIDTGLDKIQIGHRTELEGWVVDTQVNMRLQEKTFYDLTLVMYGTVATVWVDQSVSATFDFGNALNDGLIGLGTSNAKATFDNFQVQKLPPTITFEYGVAEKPFDTALGTWELSDGRYTGSPLTDGDTAIATQYLEVCAYSRLNMEAAIQTSTLGGLVFDYYSNEDFKFVAIKADSPEIIIGHRTAQGWSFDAVAVLEYTITADQSYTLGVGMFGSSVSVTVNGEAVAGFVYNSLLNDGEYGLLSKDGMSTFDNFLIRGDDPAYQTLILPNVSIADTAVVEGDGIAYITVELSKSSDEILSVDYLTIDGTAKAGTDYVTNIGTITFQPGETSKQIALAIVNDTTEEGEETLTVSLINPGSGLELGKDTALVTIHDDDAPPVVSVSDAVVTEGDSDTTTVPVEFTLSKASSNTVTVKYATADLTAFAGSDYLAATNTVTFAPGDTSVWIDFTVIGDEEQESNEDFRISLSEPSNATIGDGEGVVTIVNDDQIPTVTVTATDASASETDLDAGVFTISRDFTDGPLAVVLNLGGLAVVNEDYTVIASGGYWDGIDILTLADGVASATLTITPIDDDIAEGTEDVVLTVISNAAYTIGTESATVQISDNDTPLPSLSVDLMEIPEGDKFNNRTTFTARLSEASADPVTVTVKTLNGTALWGDDFTYFESTLTFNPGETTKTFVVRIIGDTAAEGTENFFIELSGAANAVIAGDGKFEMTILDDDGSPLTAAEAPAETMPVEALTGDMLAPIVDEAVLRWTRTLAGDAASLAVLQDLDVSVADLSGLTLGLAGGNTILIDADAAGWGWYVDETPADDVEFTVPGGEDEGRMDLLTVVMHEMGHVLGYDDRADGPDNLMSATLDAGDRHTPDSGLVVMTMDDLMDDAQAHEAGDGDGSWLRDFLIKSGRAERSPFEPLEDMLIVIPGEEAETV